jgi:tRNA A37 N6-isopentenylltransferase MiaA
VLRSFVENVPLDRKQVIEDSFEASECYELLKIADCKAANFLHPNDKRKIVNALFSYFKRDQSKGSRDKL